VTRLPPSVPQSSVPAHVAIIMDGNGRWAQQRHQPRALGHRAGVRSVRKVLRAAHSAGVQYLTIFAFSQENWKRPELEVKLLMQLFVATLGREVASLNRNNVRIRFIGSREGFAPKLQQAMQQAIELTKDNTGLTLLVAVDYGGQWDIVQAARRVLAAGGEITTESLELQLDTEGVPPPDLLVRTGGEQRISNFMLWQLAYTELYFCDTLWPDFGDAEFTRALEWFASRDRRFGRLPESA
jgi:undecaprenyl diphosphate synthase